MEGFLTFQTNCLLSLVASFALQGPQTQCFAAPALGGAGTLNSMGSRGARVSRPPAQPKSICISKACDLSASPCWQRPYATTPVTPPMRRVQTAGREEPLIAPFKRICKTNEEACSVSRKLGLKAVGSQTACRGSPLRLSLLVLCVGALLLLCARAALLVDATPFEGPRFVRPAPPPPDNPYAAYNVRGYAGEPAAYYVPQVVYAAQPAAVLDPRLRAPPTALPQFNPYAYGYGYTPTPEQTRQALRLAGAPEPFIAQPYDYTKDFLKSLQSIKELKDPAVRTSMLALKELEPTRPGSLFGDQEVKVVVLWKRYDEKWGLSVSQVQLPQGHNPTLHAFSKVFLLNAATAASSKCSKNWYRMRLKAEAKLQSGPEMIKPLKQEDIMTPLRSFKELRLVLEDVPSYQNKRCFTRTLYRRFGDFLPVTMYETLPAVSVKILVLKPVSMERHVSDESAPYEDGPVIYSFESPYKTSFVRELQIPIGSNPTLYRVAKLYLQRALHFMKGCSISNSSLVPSFAAIAKDESGKVHVLPLNNLDTPVRALGWAAAEGEAESGRELTVNLVLFLRNILKSEIVINLHN
ncbi:hypothetical protein Emed_005869 [Eimeria media]